MKINSKMILPIFIIFIMLFSTIGFIYTGEGEDNIIEESDYGKLEYGGKIFDITDGRYRYRDVELVYTPEELYNISVNVKDFNFLSKIYISINETAPENINKLAFMQNAVLASYDDNTSMKYNIPMKDCSDGDENTTIVKLINTVKDGIFNGVNSIRQEGNCYILEGELNLLIERLILEVL